MALEAALGWYQSRISHYDKQSWENTVEQRILQGLSYTPRKTANPKTEFIDVDLVRGKLNSQGKIRENLTMNFVLAREIILYYIPVSSKLLFLMFVVHCSSCIVSDLSLIETFNHSHRFNIPKS